MASMPEQQVVLREIGEDVTVPDNPVARGMYFLKCICDVLDLDDGNLNIEKFTDFGSYHLLSEDDIDTLTGLIALVDFDKIWGRCLFQDEIGEFCGNTTHKIFELEDVKTNMVIKNDVSVAGQNRRIKRVMFVKSEWMTLYYTIPAQFLLPRWDRRIEELNAKRRALAYSTTSSCCIIV